MKLRRAPPGKQAPNPGNSAAVAHAWVGRLQGAPDREQRLALGRLPAEEQQGQIHFLRCAEPGVLRGPTQECPVALAFSRSESGSNG